MFPAIIEQAIWRIKDVLSEHPNGALTPEAHGTIAACLVMLRTATEASFRVNADIDQAGELAERLTTEVLPDHGAKLRIVLLECLQRVRENYEPEPEEKA